MNGVIPFVAAALSAAAVSLAFAQEPRPREDRLSPVPSLTVSGRGEVSAAPDLAVVRLGATAQHQEAAGAQGTVNQTMQRVLEAIRKAGIANEQIQTSSLSLQPLYDHRPRHDDGGMPRVSGYQADMTVTVRVLDLNKVGPVIDAGLNAGANQFQGVSFELQNDTGARARALQQAVRSAQEKARALSEVMDVRLEHVVDVVEGSTDFVRPMYERAAMMDFAAGAPATPIETGQLQISAHVTLRYRISGAGLPGPAVQQPAPPHREPARQDPISAPAPRGPDR